MPEAAPKKPRLYPSLREAFDKGREIAPRRSVGHLHNAANKSACAWGAIMLGLGFGGDHRGEYMLATYGPKQVGGIHLAAIHMKPPVPLMSAATPIRDAVIHLNDCQRWDDGQFRDWLGKVDRAIEEHLG